MESHVGTTSLTIWDQTNRPVSFLVRVTIDTKDLSSRISQAFPGADVKVRQVGPQIILDGQVPDSKTMADILQLVSYTLMSSPSLRGAAGGGMGGGGMAAAGGGGGGMGGGMAAEWAAAGWPAVGWPAGSDDAYQSRDRARSAAGAAARQDRRDQSKCDSHSRRELALRSRAIDDRLGPPAATPARSATTRQRAYSQAPRRGIRRARPGDRERGRHGHASGANSPLFGVFDAGHFSLFIDALRTNSLAKILAEPNLMALDGQPARFLVGGMFPFPVPQSRSIPGGTAVVTVQFQRFGTILTFLPEILPNDVIRLDVEPVISKLNYAQIHDGQWRVRSPRSPSAAPDRRRAARGPDAGDRRVAPVASPTPRTMRVPGLGDLPIVGPWFSANTIETIETETIVLVTPELVSPLDKKEVTEAPGDRVYAAQRPRVLSARPDRREAGPRVPGDHGPARPAQSHEAFPERAAVGGRPARPLGLIGDRAGAIQHSDAEGHRDPGRRG